MDDWNLICFRFILIIVFICLVFALFTVIILEKKFGK